MPRDRRQRRASVLRQAVVATALFALVTPGAAAGAPRQLAPVWPARGAAAADDDWSLRPATGYTTHVTRLERGTDGPPARRSHGPPPALAQALAGPERPDLVALACGHLDARAPGRRVTRGLLARAPPRP